MAEELMMKERNRAIISLKATHFSNPGGQKFTGGCCDFFQSKCNFALAWFRHCDYQFMFCVENIRRLG